MANVISSLLVGIGFDFDKKSAKEVDKGIDGIKSKALQLGAVVAGAYGIKKLATGFADSADMLGKFSETFGGTASDIQALGSALTTEGGSLESFMGQLESLERARARIKVGDVAFFAPAGKAGLDPNVIANAENATDAYIGLADAFAKMSQQERINAAEALGLDAPSIRLLSQGREQVESMLVKYKAIRPLSEQMTEDAAEFNRQWVEVKANLSGIADAIGSELLPVINDVTAGINEWFSSDRLGDLKAIAELTKATFGRGDADETAEATGLPKWLFTRDLDETVDAMFGGEDSPKLDVIETLKTEVSTFNPMQSFLDNTGYTTKGTLYDTSNSMYNKGQTQQQINVNANFTLDGQVIDRKIIKVVDGMAQNAIDDISSSTGG
tara:strand:- start:690 stop:1838 length:1149 start_codon:yes stop_codon:yes gene_type:complete